MSLIQESGRTETPAEPDQDATVDQHRPVAQDAESPEEVLRRIEATIGDDQESADDGDSEDDPLYRALKLLLPGHAFFERETSLPSSLKGLLGNAVVLGGSTKTTARWSTPDGMFAVMFMECGEHEGLYNIAVRGPGENFWDKTHQTVEQALKLVHDLEVA